LSVVVGGEGWGAGVPPDDPSRVPIATTAITAKTPTAMSAPRLITTARSPRFERSPSPVVIGGRAGYATLTLLAHGAGVGEDGCCEDGGGYTALDAGWVEYGPGTDTGCGVNWLGPDAGESVDVELGTLGALADEVGYISVGPPSSSTIAIPFGRRRDKSIDRQRLKTSPQSPLIALAGHACPLALTLRYSAA
jgi:hypothetical protein